MANKVVWVFNQYAGSPKNSSGAGERHFFLAKQYQKKANIETVIFSGSYNHLFIQNPQVSGLSTEEIIDGVRFCWIKVPKYNPDSALGRVLSWFFFCFFLLLTPKKRYLKPSTIIVSSMSMFPILNALFYKWRHKEVEVIFEVRDIWPLTPIQLGGHNAGHPLMRLMAAIEKLAYRASDKVVSVLPNLKEHIDQQVNKEVDFHWIPNGIEPAMYEGSQEAEVSAVTDLFPKNQFLVGYTGAIGTANAMGHLIEAAELVGKETSDISFVIIGDGPDREKLQQKAEALKLNNVHFYGKVKKGQVINLLKKVDIAYIGWQNKALYHFGVSPNKYNDYMLAKKPILNSCNLVKDTIFEAENGKIVAAEDPKAIAEGILALYKLSPEERKAMGERGYEYLWVHRTYDKLSDQYLQLIK